jgi:hypothetical protein
MTDIVTIDWTDNHTHNRRDFRVVFSNGWSACYELHELPDYNRYWWVLNDPEWFVDECEDFAGCVALMERTTRCTVVNDDNQPIGPQFTNLIATPYDEDWL